jgi:hypothetical protein
MFLKGLINTNSKIHRRPRGSFEDFSMDLKETGANVRIWIYLPEDKINWRPLVNGALNLQFHRSLVT